jgi:branched-chain amino acid transport system permease protein
MSAAPKSGAAKGDAKVLSPPEIAKDLLITALITVPILVPIVAIRTQLDQGVLTWHSRFWLALLMGAIVVIGRGLMYVFVWNPRAAAALDLNASDKVGIPKIKLSRIIMAWVLPLIIVAILIANARYIFAGLILVLIAFREAIRIAFPDRKWSELFGPYVAPGLLIFGILLPVAAHIGHAYNVELPNFGELRLIDLSGYILIYIMLGWGLNVVVGLAGLLDLGYVAFYAVGAYSYALLSTVYFPRWFGVGVVPYAFYITLPVAGLLAGLWGVILGFPVLRLRGDYLAIVTLAFGEIIRLVLINWFSFTNGPQGINVPKLTFFGYKFKEDEQGGFSEFTKFISDHFFPLAYDRVHSYIFLYYVIFALALVTYFVTKRLRRLPIGRAWEALREDEIACRSLGINTTNTKLTAFAIGAMFGGIAGSFFAARQGYIDPNSFVYIESALILAIVVLGGLGSPIGIVFSATAIMGSFEIFRELGSAGEGVKSMMGETVGGWLSWVFSQFPAQLQGSFIGTDPVQFRMIAVGMAMVVMMLFRPRGFVTKREPTVYLKEKKSISGDMVAEGHG